MAAARGGGGRVAVQGEAEGGAREYQIRAMGRREGTGSVKRKTGNRPSANKNHRETEKHLNLHSLYHVGQKYDGH